MCDKKYKQFNLEEAKAGKPLQDRNGNSVRIVCFDKVSSHGYGVLGLIKRDNGIEKIRHFDSGGKCYSNEYDNDLVMKLTKKEGWINIYKNTIFQKRESNARGYIFDSEAEAIGCSDSSRRITTIKIEWEE